MDRIVRWAPLEWFGAEHLRVRADAGGATAESAVVGEWEGRPFGLRYRLRCDGQWRLREAEFALVGEDRGLRLVADGEGRWADGDGRPLEGLAGCVDVDVSMTPFTNTLPIRRLGLARGEARTLRVAYVPVPDLAPRVVEQRYTCLEPGRLYRYEGFPSGFVADLPVDADGLVLDYPGIWRRVG
jgi:hypothetical protein